MSDWHVKYDMLPAHMQEHVRAYVEDGEEPDRFDFLYAVLCNDLVRSFGFADPTNLLAMHTWALWLFNECPLQAWGSPAKVEAWVKRGGLNLRNEVSETKLREF